MSGVGLGTWVRVIVNVGACGSFSDSVVVSINLVTTVLRLQLFFGWATAFRG